MSALSAPVAIDSQTAFAYSAPLVILSLGLGQDSITLVYLLGLDLGFRRRYAGDAKIMCVFSDSLDEHADTYAQRTIIADFCAAHDMIAVFLSKGDGFHTGPWANGLRGFYEANNAIGSVAYQKTCSENLKILPIYRFLAQWIAVNLFENPGLAYRKRSLYAYTARYGKLRVILGIAAGEEDRIEKPDAPCKPCGGHGTVYKMMENPARVELVSCRPCGGTGRKKPRHKWMEACIERVYPLVDVGMDRAACQAYIQRAGRPLPPPSQCFMCPFKSPIEILWSSIVDPARFAEWERLEARKLAANAHMNAVVNPKTGKVENKNYGVFKTKTLGQILAQAKVDYAGWTFERLAEYRMSHGHCVASTY